MLRERAAQLIQNEHVLADVMKFSAARNGFASCLGTLNGRLQFSLQPLCAAESPESDGTSRKVFEYPERSGDKPGDVPGDAIQAPPIYGTMKQVPSKEQSSFLETGN